MKTLKFLAIILPMCVALVACGGKKYEPTNPTENQLKQEALNLAKFLTDNYAVGDSVFFTTESDEIEGFVVKQNYFDTMQVIIEAEEEEEFRIEVDGYQMQTILQSKKNTFRISLIHSIEYNKAYTDGMLEINYKPDFDLSDTEVDDESIIITIADKECILTKNIGVTNVSSGEHTWDLVTAK